MSLYSSVITDILIWLITCLLSLQIIAKTTTLPLLALKYVIHHIRPPSSTTPMQFRCCAHRAHEIVMRCVSSDTFLVGTTFISLLMWATCLSGLTTRASLHTDETWSPVTSSTRLVLTHQQVRLMSEISWGFHNNKHKWDNAQVKAQV